MLVTELKPYLEELYLDEKKMRSVVFDGPWGCGKTYNLNSFISESIESGDNTIFPNVIYVSLFGLQNVNELVIRLAEKLNPQFYYIVDGKYYLKAAEPDKKPYNDVMIVFDDIERMDESLKFGALYGVINSLVTNGFKVVCFSYSDDVSKNGDYRKFLERTFEKIISVTADPSLPFETTKKFSFNFCESLLKYANDNLRLIEKAESTFQEIKKYLYDLTDKITKDSSRLDDESIFLHALFANRVLFSFNLTKPSFAQADTIDDFRAFHYQRYLETLGECPANEMYFLKHGLNPSIDSNILDGSFLLTKCLQINDYYAYIKEYWTIKEDGILGKPPLSEEPFFLDDAGKAEYKKQFMENLPLMDFSKAEFRYLFRTFIKYYLADLTISEENEIAQKFVASLPSDESEKIIGDMFIFYGEQSDIFRKFQKKLEALLKSKESSLSIQDLENKIEKKDFNAIMNFCHDAIDCDMETKTSIAIILENNGFLMSDLGNTISGTYWNCCLEVARLLLTIPGYFDRLMILLLEMRKKNNSSTLDQRCKILAGYNRNSPYYSQF